MGETFRWVKCDVFHLEFCMHVKFHCLRGTEKMGFEWQCISALLPEKGCTDLS